MELFTVKFRPRLVEMTDDVDSHVAEAVFPALRSMHKLDILVEEDVQRVR